MERPLTQKPLIVQDENSTIHHKKAVVHGKSKSSKPISRKGGAAVESRKALNDITNKSFLRPEASKKNTLQNKKHNISGEGSLRDQFIESEESSKTKSTVNDHINVAEEGFLHDHNKCTAADKEALERHFWDVVLPGHDAADPVPKVAKIDPDIGRLPEMKELNEDWLNSFSWWKSPPHSPTGLDSPPLSPFAWKDELDEFILREE